MKYKGDSVRCIYVQRFLIGRMRHKPHRSLVTPVVESQLSTSIYALHTKPLIYHLNTCFNDQVAIFDRKIKHETKRLSFRRE